MKAHQQPEAVKVSETKHLDNQGKDGGLTATSLPSVSELSKENL
jgi:hypothetical protein